MKKIYSVIAGLLLTVSIWSQAPKKMSYQAVVRNGSNALVSSTVVGMQISILQGSVSGTAVYVETQTPTTNANGLASLEIGAGVAVTGTMAGIDWANGPYFIKTETDPAGGTAYSISGTTELVSVPYALHSNCVPVSVSGTGDTLTIGCHSVIIPGISVANTPGGGGGGGFPAGTVNCASGATAVVDVTNPTTGKIWMDRNLGASQAATSSTDANSYGDLYQWGRRADGHQCRTSATTTTLSSTDQPVHGDFILANSGNYDWRSPQNDNLWQGINGVNNPCPSGYRLPTNAELDAERLSWSQNNSAGAFASPLKLPMAGGRDLSDGSLYAVGAYGDYWSSTVNGASAGYLYFGSSDAYMVDFYRAHGLPVRCLKD
jgi:uncharacterized protein (TIGR02145 family)